MSGSLTKTAALKRVPRGMVPIIATLIIGAIVSTALYIYQSDVLAKQLQAAFSAGALTHELTMQKGYKDYYRAGEGFEALYATHDTVAPNEFGKFTERAFQLYPAMKWAAWVPAPGVGANGAPVKGGHSVAGADSMQLPIAFATGLGDYRQAASLKGLEVGRVPQWHEALVRARNSGEPQIALADPSVSSAGIEHGILMAWPVYRNGASHATIGQRRRNIRGYVIGLVDGKAVVEKALAFGVPVAGGITLETDMGGISGKKANVWTHISRSHAKVNIPQYMIDRLGHHLDFKLGGQHWTIISTAVQGFFKNRDISTPFKTAALSMLMTILIMGYFFLNMRATRIREGLEAERLEAAEEKARESETLNTSIIDILRSVAKTAKGDLTVQAPVREDVTGALSDAINSMSDSTARTLARVAATSREVRSASIAGRDTVLQTSRGMNEIRGTIQETGKRIKQLGERSQEITGIVKLIDDISERTSVLALNANMQAAIAGEAGRGFRVVADEVQRLAERSKEATDQIGKLVSAIQTETNDTMATMDRAISEVVKGGEMADEAAAKVTHLDELGGELLESIQAFILPESYVRESQADVAERTADDRRVA
jgi:methyl-accepting chemotaxis protein